MNQATTTTNLLNKATQIWTQHYANIEAKLIEGLLHLAEDRLQHDAEIRLVIEKVYELLPTAVRLVLPRDYFINKVLEQKKPLLKKVQSMRAKTAPKPIAQTKQRAVKSSTSSTKKVNPTKVVSAKKKTS